jgi:hypothetical protein
MNPIGLFIAGALTGYAVSSRRRDKRVRSRGGYAGQLQLPAASTISTGPACSTWTILDQPTANLLVRKAYVEGRLAGVTDPYRLTERALKLVVPQCHTRRKGMRNMGELDLYTSFFDSVVALLADDFPESDALSHIHADFQAWHDHQAQVLS